MGVAERVRPALPMTGRASRPRATIAVAVVGAVLLSGAAVLQPGPGTVRVSVADSVHVVGGESWPYRFLETDDGETWVEIAAPDGGGAVRVPSLYLRTIVDRFEAHAGGGGGNVLLAVPRVNFAAVAAVVAFGIGAAVAFPLLWYRRRYRRERERRRSFQETARLLSKSREEERLRIARDIHDGPLQNIHSLQMQLAIVSGGGAVGPEQRPRLVGAQDDAQTAIVELRAIAEALRTPALTHFGLPAALRSYADLFRQRHPDMVVEDDVTLARELPDDIETALFRIAQEALNNVGKHSGASRVWVSLGERDDVELVVEDDGSGFPDLSPEALEGSGHFGLAGMRERARAIGAVLTTSQGRAGGARVAVRVPPCLVAPGPTSERKGGGRRVYASVRSLWASVRDSPTGQND